MHSLRRGWDLQMRHTWGYRGEMMTLLSINTQGETTETLRRSQQPAVNVCDVMIFPAVNLGLRLSINHLKTAAGEVRQQFGSRSNPGYHLTLSHISPIHGQTTAETCNDDDEHTNLHLTLPNQTNSTSRSEFRVYRFLFVSGWVSGHLEPNSSLYCPWHSKPDINNWQHLANRTASYCMFNMIDFLEISQETWSSTLKIFWGLRYIL